MKNDKNPLKFLKYWMLFWNKTNLTLQMRNVGGEVNTI